MSTLAPPLPPGARVRSAISRIRNASVVQARGRVAKVVGLVIESEGPIAAVGEVCRIDSGGPNGEETLAEVVGFRDRHVLLMPLGELHGIRPGCEVTATGAPMQVPAGDALLGRVIDSLGRPMDGRGPLHCSTHVSTRLQPPDPIRRQRIKDVFRTRIKALDTFIPCGRGQRMGIFAGSGVGKSTLLGMIASRAEADVNVIALIGERGREVREFLERDLDEEGRRKSVVVVATSNEPALARLKGAFAAMSIAEHFRNQGLNVLLLMDSVTRFAMAQREIGLAVGEPPATRGYPPSVFALLPQLLERAGTAETGAITGLFTVLVEADDMNDPIADSVRSILDGHIVLTRELATENHFPAIDVLESVSRLNRDLLTPAQVALAGMARDSLATYRRNRDLISIGAYAHGSNPGIDQAIRLQDPLRRFLRQGVSETMDPERSWELLTQTCAHAEAARGGAA